MAGVADVLIRRYFTAPTFRLGLAMGGREVTDPGYERQTPRQWDIEGPEARTAVTFGPMFGRVSVDSVWLFDGDDLVDSIPVEAGPRVLVPGDRLDYTAVVALLDAPTVPDG